MITKKDWKNAEDQFTNLIVNAEVQVECYKAALERVKQKLNDFPEDEDKEIEEEIKKDLKIEDA